MQAVILAAGEGSRLSSVSGGLPKCLLDVGGKPIIEHQIATLTDNGINQILVVVGYRAEAVRAAVGGKAEFVDNPKYKETNSLYSLWLARDWVKGPFVLINCDLVFHPDILHRLLRAHGSALAFDSTSSRGLEQTKVVLSKGRVADLGKDIASEAARGESLGLLKFDAEGAKALFARANYLVLNGEEKNWVIEGIRSACSEIEIRGINVAGLPWTEVDFPGDLEKARKEVWPEIRRGYWKRVVHWKRIRWAAAVVTMGSLVFAGLVLARAFRQAPIEWETIHPPKDEGSQIRIVAAEKTKTQRWWLCKTGGPPLEVEAEGPETVHIELRLLLPSGSSAQARFVGEIGLDGKPADWRVFRSTPEAGVIFESYAVCDKETIEFEVPKGKHGLQVRLIAGTSDHMLARVRRAQAAEAKKIKDE